MRYLILIIATIILTAFSDKKSDTAKKLIDHTDYCLIYKWDSLSNGYLLFNIPSIDTMDYLKKILTFDEKFKLAKPISPDYRFDLISKDSIIEEFFVEKSKPCLSLKSDEFEASRQLDFDLCMYLKNIEQNVYSTRDSRRISFRLKGNLSNKICGFSKHSDSTSYSNLFIHSYYDGVNENKQDLEALIKKFTIYWKVAERNLDIKPKTANVGYPREYNDILKRQIKAFQNSTEWKNYIKQNRKEPNFVLTKSIMLGSDVYKPLNDFLKTKGYEIVDLSIEKLGYLDSEYLNNLGFDKEIVVPMPHMVLIKIGKVVGNISYKQ